MKTLDEYNLIRDFIGSQGIQPTVGMLCVQPAEWSDLVLLAGAWKQELEEYRAEQEAKLADMSEDELGQMDKAAENARRIEDEKALFYSSGHEPE